MSFYLYMLGLGDNYCDVDVEYDIIDGDPSVGLRTDYEFSVTYVNENGLTEDFTEKLTEDEIAEVIEAIEKDIKESNGMV